MSTAASTFPGHISQGDSKTLDGLQLHHFNEKVDFEMVVMQQWDNGNCGEVVCDLVRCS